jgi:hypothetical protein
LQTVAQTDQSFGGHRDKGIGGAVFAREFDEDDGTGEWFDDRADLTSEKTMIEQVVEQGYNG